MRTPISHKFRLLTFNEAAGNLICLLLGYSVSTVHTMNGRYLNCDAICSNQRDLSHHCIALFHNSNGPLNCKMCAYRSTTHRLRENQSHSLEEPTSPMRIHWKLRIWPFSQQMPLKVLPRESSSAAVITPSWDVLLVLHLAWTLARPQLPRKSIISFT